MGDLAVLTHRTMQSMLAQRTFQTCAVNQNYRIITLATNISLTNLTEGPMQVRAVFTHRSIGSILARWAGSTNSIVDNDRNITNSTRIFDAFFTPSAVPFTAAYKQTSKEVEL